MRKSLSRTLYLIGLAVVIVATVLLFISLIGSTTVTNGSQTTVTSIGNPALFGVSIFLYVAGGILGTIAWVGALVKMAQLGQWVWFVLLLAVSGIAMLVYIFAGPTTPPASAAIQPPVYPNPPSYGG